MASPQMFNYENTRPLIATVAVMLWIEQLLSSIAGWISLLETIRRLIQAF